MRYILTSAVLTVLLFPALVSGETVKWKDLVKLDGLLYKKFTDVPFSGEVTGLARGRVRNGKQDGPWLGYSPGRVRSKGTYKNGEKVGPWVEY